MRYHHFLFAFTLAFGASAWNPSGAQNLVSNGSFEDFINCPQTVGAWQQVVGWDSPYTTSADYFNECAPPIPAGVPANNLGYQEAADGDAYMGIVTCDPNTIYQELIHAELLQPLQVGVPVYLCFKVAVGGFGLSATNSAMLTCKGVGMKFFVDMPANLVEWDQYFQVAPNSAAVHLDVVPTDTAVWYVVGGTYVPDSAYTNVVIGNFFDVANSSVGVLYSTGFGLFPFSYVFVDDVRVTYDLTACNVGEAIDELGLLTLTAYPNPFTGHCTVLFDGGFGRPSRVELLDQVGRVVENISLSIQAGFVDINSSGLATGRYTLRLGDEQRWYGHSSLVHVNE